MYILHIIISDFHHHLFQIDLYWSYSELADEPRLSERVPGCGPGRGERRGAEQGEGEQVRGHQQGVPQVEGRHLGQAGAPLHPARHQPGDCVQQGENNTTWHSE